MAEQPLAMVYGGGGVVGIAYTAGVAAGLTTAGIPVATAPALGTSAGSWTASALALGLSYHDLVDLPVPRCPASAPECLPGSPARPSARRPTRGSPSRP